MPLDILWKELAEESRVNRLVGRLQRRITTGDSNADVYAGWHGRGQVPSIMVESNEDPGDRIDRLPETRAFTTTIESIPGHAGRHLVVLELTDDRHQDLFASLGDDLVARLEAEPDVENRVTVFLERLYRWHRFFSRVGEDTLSWRHQQGLWAEIHVLLEIVTSASDLDLAVSMWHGPNREDRDFLGHGMGLEVKSTAGAQPVTIFINNEHQLDSDGLETLILVHVHLHRMAGIGSTLVDQVDRLRSSASEHPVLLEKIEDRLLEAGYHDQHRERYREHGYRVEYTSLYEIIDNFPRIVPTMLPNGVGQVSYRLGSTGLDSFERDQDWLQAILTRAQDG